MSGKTAGYPLQGTKPRGDDPYTDAAAVTPADGTDLTFQTRGLYIGVTGDVTVVMADDKNNANTILFKAVPAGTQLRVCVRRVMATATTATNILALY